MLEHINPADLTIAENVRSEAKASLDPQFLRSIRERGVLAPITADRMEDGTLVVRYGHRRTLAAQQLALALVPVDVRDQAQTATDRIIDQLAENDHRAELSRKDRTHAVAQLALAGMNVRSIAKQTAMRPKQVEAALIVAKSEAASNATASLTLEQAAQLADFEDNPEAVAQLEAAAERGQFDHELSRQLIDREQRTAARAVAGWIETQGMSLVDQRQTWGSEAQVKTLAALRDAEGNELDGEAHKQCPGHVAWVGRGYRHSEDDAMPEGAVPYGRHGDLMEPGYGCADWKANGHRHLYSERQSASAKPDRADMTTEQIEAERAERRRVIANNKAWDAAETVRREWLAEFATRRTAPKGAEDLVALALLEDWQAKAYGWAPIGIEPAAFSDEIGGSVMDRAPKARALHIALTLALYRWESNTGRHTWRTPSHRDRRVLAAMQSWGYTLSDVEAEVVNGPAEDPEG